MGGKVIHVDFESASKERKQNKNPKNNKPIAFKPKKSRIKFLLHKIRKALCKIFRKNRRKDNNISRKHWL